MQIATADQAATLVAKMAKSLNEQAMDAVKWRDYYEGKQPLRFSSAEWRAWFGDQYEDFADNWCAPVVEATAERQRWIGFRPYEADAADKDLGRVMSINGADVEFGLAATEAQYARRMYSLVWGNPDDQATPTVTFESPTEMIVRYAPGTRREPVAALKRWQDEDTGEVFATLYTPQYLWKFRIAGSGSSLILPASMMGGWQPRVVDGEPWPLPNPMKRVPVSEMPNRTSLSTKPLSAIAGVAAMQDAINLLWAHLFTASDFAAMPQRILMGAQLPKIPVLDEDGQKIGEKPIDLPEANIRRILNFDSPTAKVDQWDPADMTKFLDVIKQARGHVMDQTRTPAYYFSSGTTIANISGDTVKALDAGLVQKVKGVNIVMGDGMRRTAEMICLAQGDKRKAAAMAAGATLWGDEEIRSEAQRADSMSKYREIGFPFAWVAKQKIDDPDELQEVLDAYEAERRDPTLENLARKSMRNAEQAALDGQ